MKYLVVFNNTINCNKLIANNYDCKDGLVTFTDCWIEKSISYYLYQGSYYSIDIPQYKRYFYEEKIFIINREAIESIKVISDEIIFDNISSLTKDEAEKQIKDEKEKVREKANELLKESLEKETQKHELFKSIELQDKKETEQKKVNNIIKFFKRLW